jgi:hypothetical protein
MLLAASGSHAMLLADALDHVIREIDPLLVPEPAVERLVRTADDLTDGAVAAYIECRPDPAVDTCDLLACFVSTGPIRDVETARSKWSRRREHGQFVGTDPSDKSDNSSWEVAEAAQECRRTPGTALHGRSPLLWLEFDDAGASDRVPSPSVCICIEPTYLARERYREPADSVEAMVIESATLAGLSAGDVEALLSCIRQLPGGARAIHLSFMQARTPKTTKVYLRMPLDQATSYLEAIGWGGDASTVREVLEWHRQRDDCVHLDLSIAGGAVLRRLGLAFPNARRTDRFDDDVFDGLAARSLAPHAASRAKKAARAWSLTEPALRRDAGWTHVVHRWIDQKLVLDDSGCELKLYLAVRPLPALFGGMATAGGR